MDLARFEQLGIVKAAGRRMLAVHQFLYERSGGRVGHRLLGAPCLLLRTTGARTGRTRTNSLVYGRDAGDYLVVASNGGSPRAPGWYHNLRANPEADTQIGTQSLPVTGRPRLPGDAEYDRLWNTVNAINHDRYRGYQQATTRPIPIVVLTPRASG